MENYNIRSRTKKLVSLLLVTILLMVVVSKAGLALATVRSTDLDIAILQTNGDRNTDLAQMTLSSQLDQSKIAMIVKTPTTPSQLEDELKQSKSTSILVLIGHGTTKGLVVEDKVIPWQKLKELLAQSKYPWKFLLACYSDEISDMDLKIAGFRDKIDAEGWALLIGFGVKKLIHNIHDEDLLDRAIEKSKKKANPLAARKIFFIHGFSGDLSVRDSEWDELKDELVLRYPGLYEYEYYSYTARGFDNLYYGISDITADLYNYIIQKTDSGDIIHLVGHSMGGILIRDLIRLYRPSLDAADVTVKKAVIIAAPNWGSPIADVLQSYYVLGIAIFIILFILLGLSWPIAVALTEYFISLIDQGFGVSRFRYFATQNPYFDDLNYYTGIISGIEWYGARVYIEDDVALLVGALCAFFSQSYHNDHMISVSSTKLPYALSDYIIDEIERHPYDHGVAHRDDAMVTEIASWLQPRGAEILRTSGTLSGSGATQTFSKSSLSGTYTVVMMGNEEADFDFYAKWNSPPTTSSYDARGYSGYSSEYFTVSGSGTLYVMVRSYSGSGNWRANILTHAPSVDGQRKVGTLSSSGNTATYSLTGSGPAWVYLAGPDSGDFDLYIKWNSPPTTSSYDCRGYSSWSQEICNAIGSGILYYMVRSYRGSGQYTMVAMIF